ncbi:hypothetical protein ABZ897_54635 [Nonomuraea sp. NPDC046802]|uniref:hypothetical protein n=1 Tax=Nonomuraea sp. NPDC046802 TaxID=3154919 RepID=UPI0033CB0CD9
MKVRVRLLLATAMGAAVLLTGTAAPALADDFQADASAEAYIPLQNDVVGVLSLKLTDPASVTGVTGAIEPPGKAARPVTFDFRPDAARLTGRWQITKDDQAGDWKLRVAVARGTGSKTTAFVIKVSGKQGISAASITPSPVKLVKGGEVKVTVEASVQDATTVSAKLVSQSGGDSFDLGDLAQESDGVYRGVTYFGDDATAGPWTMEIYARKGG